MNQLSLIQLISISILPLLFAVTVHEVAHGWVANRLGDPTARLMGRLTLNPLPHIDWIGTIAVPILLLATTGFMFGWAKPVPINWRNLHQPRRDIALVAAAGPTANFLMACIWGLFGRIGYGLSASIPDVGIPLAYMGQIGIMINVALLVLNLIPIPPLDGSRVMASLLPPRWAYHYVQIEPYGFWILIGLMISGLLNTLLFYPIVTLNNFIMQIFIH